MIYNMLSWTIYMDLNIYRNGIYILYSVIRIVKKYLSKTIIEYFNLYIHWAKNFQFLVARDHVYLSLDK